MKFFLFSIFLILIATKISQSSENIDGPNVCKFLQPYNVTVVVTDLIPHEETVTIWCPSFPPRCKKISIVLKEVHRTEVIQKTKIVKDCCEGFVLNAEENTCE